MNRFFSVLLPRLQSLLRWLRIGIKYTALVMLIAFFGAIAPGVMMLGMVIIPLVGLGDTAISLFKLRSIKAAFQSVLVFFVLTPIAMAAILTPIHAVYYFFLEHIPASIAAQFFQNPWEADVALPTTDLSTSVMAALALPAIALVILRERFWLAQHIRQIENLATSKINAAALGVIELVGTYQPGPVPESIPEWGASPLKQPFYLEDATGRVLVDPTGTRGIEGLWAGIFRLELAEVNIERKALAPGDPLFIVGTLAINEKAPPEATGTEALVVRRPPVTGEPVLKKLQEFRRDVWGGGAKGRSLQDTFFISDCDEPGARKRLRAMHRKILWRGAIMLAACLWLLASRLDRVYPRIPLPDDPAFYTEDPAVHELLTYAYHPLEGYRNSAFVAILQETPKIPVTMKGALALELFLNSPYKDARYWASWNLDPQDGRDSNPCNINTSYSRYTSRLIAHFQRKETDRDTRVMLLRLLARIREPRETLLPMLMTVMHSDPEPYVRQTATVALRVFTPERGQVTPALAAALESSDPAVRAQAGQDLEKLAPGAAPILTALGQALTDTDYYTRSHARTGLVRFGEAALPELERTFQHGTEEQKAEAVWGMLEVNPAPERLLPFLHRALQSELYGPRMAAVGGVTQLKKIGQPLHPEVVALLHHPDAKTAMAVISTLANLEPPPHLVSANFAIIRKGLCDPSDGTRFAAIKLLKASPLPREEIVREMVELSRSAPLPEIRATMLVGLADFPEAAALSVPRLLECLEDKNTRTLAVVALGKIGPAGAAAAPHMVAMLREKDSWDSDDAAEALRGIGAYTTLGECLQDEDGHVRSYVFDALKRAGPAAAPAVPALIRKLEHPIDNYDVGNALQTLINIGPAAREALPAIRALLERGPQEKRPWFEAGEAIAQLTTPPEPADWAVKRLAPPILSFDFENSLTEDRYRTRFEPLAGSVSYGYGPHGRCVEFDGKAGVLLEQPIDLTGGYTLEIAFRPSLLNQGQWREPAVLDCELFKIYPEGPWKYTVWLPNTKNLGWYAGCPMQGKPEWQHTAIVWNPYLHKWQVYANGKTIHDNRDYGLGYEVVDGVYKPNTTWPQSQVRKIALGCDRDGKGFWQGSIDDLKLYDYPRSPEQIIAAAAVFVPPAKP